MLKSILMVKSTGSGSWSVWCWSQA